MANFASALKAEVLRLARKEVRKEIEGLRKAAANHRGEIAELKRRLATLEKQGARPGGRSSAKASDSEAPGTATSIRFNAKGFASHRKRLGLSAAEAGLLMGVSAQTVYGWEGGTRPRRQHLDAVAAFRKLGKRQVKAQLAEQPEE